MTPATPNFLALEYGVSLDDVKFCVCMILLARLYKNPVLPLAEMHISAATSIYSEAAKVDKPKLDRVMAHMRRDLGMPEVSADATFNPMQVVAKFLRRDRT